MFLDAFPNAKISNLAKQFLKQKHRLFINGKWVDSRSQQTFEVFNPATGEVLTTVARGNAADIDLAVKAARNAFERGAWSKFTPAERGRLLWRLADLLETHLDEFAELESLDNGKSKNIAKVTDVNSSVDLLRYMAGWATKIEGTTKSLSIPDGDFFSYTLREPVGVVGQIIPWNFPLAMAVWKLAPALATGCTMVLKPAEETPLTALRLMELFQEVGLPEGVVNCVTGLGVEAGAPLAAHPDVDKIAFTGSTEVGKLIVQASSASNLKKLSLELGGKSPNIILPDADLTAAIPTSANAIFFNHGQCCSAGSRLYAHRDVFDKVVAGITAIAKNIQIGHGLNDNTEMGPLVSQIQLDRVCGYLASGKEQGANIVTGGNRIGKQGYFVEPSVLIDTDASMKVVAEEIFGPVLCIMPFSDFNEVINLANDSIYGLAAAVWTKDVSRAHQYAKRLRAGSVWVNCYNAFDPALPFGGYKQSGWGKEMGHEVLELYTQCKAVTIALS